MSIIFVVQFSSESLQVSQNLKASFVSNHCDRALAKRKKIIVIVSHLSCKFETEFGRRVFKKKKKSTLLLHTYCNSIIADIFELPTENLNEYRIRV